MTTPATDNPLLDFLGIRRVDVAPGRATFELALGTRHLNRQGSVQGGVVATLLDAACGYAGLADTQGAGLGNAVTVSLSISYLAKARTGRLRAIARVSRMGRSVYFATGELMSESGELIATAQGAFKRNTPRPEA